MNYCKLIVVSVDDVMLSGEVRDQLAADFPFFSDSDRELLYELELVDVTDPHHGEIYIPYTFVVDRDRTIHKIYNGWWFAGRPTVEEIRMDFRELLRKRNDWVYPGNGKPGHTIG